MGLTIYTDPSSTDAPDYSPLTPAQRFVNAFRHYMRSEGIDVSHVPDAEIVKRALHMYKPPRPRPNPYMS